MKKLLVVFLISMLSLAGFGQVTIEVFTPEGEYKTHVNDTAVVCLKVVNDSTTLIIQDGKYTVSYDIGEIIVIEIDQLEVPFRVISLMIINDIHGIVRVTIWEGMNLVLFEYENSLTVVNSGKGIVYY